MEKCILIYCVRTIRLSVTAHVRCDDVITGLGERLIWCLHEYQDSGNPWHKRTKGPAPASAIWILMPFDSTNLRSTNIANLAVIYFGKNATSNFEPSDLCLKNNRISVLISIW